MAGFDPRNLIQNLDVGNPFDTPPEDAGAGGPFPFGFEQSMDPRIKDLGNGLYLYRDGDYSFLWNPGKGAWTPLFEDSINVTAPAPPPAPPSGGGGAGGLPIDILTLLGLTGSGGPQYLPPNDLPTGPLEKLPIEEAKGGKGPLAALGKGLAGIFKNEAGELDWLKLLTLLAGLPSLLDRGGRGGGLGSEIINGRPKSWGPAPQYTGSGQLPAWQGGPFDPTFLPINPSPQFGKR